MSDPINLGEVGLLSTVRFLWNTIDATEASVTRGTNGSLRVYKDGSVTQRSSSAGITDNEDFDSLTGLHQCVIDLADDTDAGFYLAGHTYDVAVVGMVLGAVTQNRTIARFTIESSPLIRQSDVTDAEDVGDLIEAASRNPVW